MKFGVRERIQCTESDFKEQYPESFLISKDEYTLMYCCSPKCMAYNECNKHLHGGRADTFVMCNKCAADAKVYPEKMCHWCWGDYVISSGIARLERTKGGWPAITEEGYQRVLDESKGILYDPEHDLNFKKSEGWFYRGYHVYLPIDTKPPYVVPVIEPEDTNCWGWLMSWFN